MFGKMKKGSTMDLVHGNVPDPDAAKSNGQKTGRKEKQAKPQKERHGFGGILQSKALWGALCLIAGGLVAFVAVPVAQEKAAALTPVVVLATDAPVGTQLTAEMLKVVEIGAGGIPKNAIASVADAAGKYMTTTGLANDILTAVRLSTQYPTDDPELLTLPAGKVAMAVALDSLEQSVASKLRAGDVIQIFAVLKDNLDPSENMVALVVPELQAVEVLSVTNNVAVNISDQDKPMDPDADRQIATVVLAVNQQQAATLAGLTANARLHSALVVRGNDAEKAAILAAQENYFLFLEETGAEENATGEDGHETDDEEQEGDEAV